MKHLMIIAILTSFVTSLAFAGEAATDCPMMRESNKRSNPKASMAAKQVVKPTSSNSSKATGM